MNAIQILEQAVEHGETFGALAARIHDKFESGAADLQAVYDDVEKFVDATVDRAKAAAGTFKDGFTKVQAKFEGTENDLKSDAEKPEPAADLAPKTETPAPVSPKVDAVIAETGAPAEHVTPAVEAHTDALANGSSPEIARVEAQVAAAQAGAEPEVAVKIADSVATQPAPEAAPVI